MSVSRSRIVFRLTLLIRMVATIYAALGIPRGTEWHDIDGRPYELYRAHPIPGLTYGADGWGLARGDQPGSPRKYASVSSSETTSANRAWRSNRVHSCAISERSSTASRTMIGRSW